MSASAGIVSDPFRAADVTWPKHECKGRTWRYLLDENAQTLDAFKNEPLAQDAGYHQIYCDSVFNKLTGTYLYGYKDEEPKYAFVVGEPRTNALMRQRMHDVPFILYEPTRGMLRLKREQMDLGVFERMVREYPDTYLGASTGEWDASLLYRLPRKLSGAFKALEKDFKIPCDRDEWAQHFYDYWDLHTMQKGPRVVGFSGPCNMNHVGVERGSTLAMIELTLDESWRAMMMHTRGSGRQFDVPLGFYIAFFLAQHTADTRGLWRTMGENWGISPNLSWRTTMLCYYQGCNYQSYECFPWAFAKEVERVEKVEGVEKKVKTTVLTENGEVLKKAYDFIRGPNGARGELYAPILLLADKAHGHDGLNRRISIKDNWGPYANEVPPNVYDQFYQDVLDAISPAIPASRTFNGWNKGCQYQSCLANSRLSDIFDVYIANPITKGKELRADQLAKYAVVMSLGGIKWPKEAKKLVSDYVAAGGTFVNVEGEENPIIKQKIGYGNVLTAPRDKAKLEEFLVGLQREVLPIRVETECELVWNVMPDGSWRVCAANNKGVEKPGDQSVTTFHDEFSQTVRFDVRSKSEKGKSAVEIRELMEGDKPVADGCWKIPPGGVRVFEIKGLDVHAKKFDLSDVKDPTVAPFEFPLVFEHDATAKYDFAKFRADYDTDEVTVECWAKPIPQEEWKEKSSWRQEGSPFMVGQGDNSASKNFGPCYWNGYWYLKRNTDQYAEWMKGPKADPTRFTKVAATLKDGVIHLFVDDKEVFSETGPILHPEGTPKCTFYNQFSFWKGASSFRPGYVFFGEIRDCHAYSKAIYPLKYEVEVKGEGEGVGEGEDATAAIQKVIDAAVEKTGEVVLRKGTYKVSQLQMRTGVTLHLEEGAVIKSKFEGEGEVRKQPLVAAEDITDFTILGPGTIAGDVLFEKCERATVRRLKMADCKLVVKDSKNVVLVDNKTATVDSQNSSRILVDGKLLEIKK